ncbi:MAG: hypothetical protein WAU81_11510 [Candidatus Aminicenantales bacterium]
MSCPALKSKKHNRLISSTAAGKEAGSQYLKAIESDARHAGAYNNLINISYMARDYGNALKYIGQAETNGVTLNPKLKQAVLQVAKK